MFFSHGTEHSKGVLILIKNSLELELKTSKVHQNGRFIILEANVQDHPFLLINLYAPNKTNEQSTFFEEISEELDNLSLAVDCNIVIGGDFNVYFDPDLDGNGGKSKRKESVKYIDNICFTNDLIDIWRIRNNNVQSGPQPELDIKFPVISLANRLNQNTGLTAKGLSPR